MSHSNILVFKTDEGIEVYGGGTSRQGGYDLMSPPPELAIGPRQVIGGSSSTSVPDGFTCGDYIAIGVQKIAIDFPDFDIPQDIDRELWVALVHDIKPKVSREYPHSVLVVMVGRGSVVFYITC